jgi:hypothetical protein
MTDAQRSALSPDDLEYGWRYAKAAYTYLMRDETT